MPRYTYRPLRQDGGRLALVRDVWHEDIRGKCLGCQAMMEDGSWVDYPEGGEFPEGTWGWMFYTGVMADA